MASYEDIDEGEPPVIDPYEVLGIDRDATADQVKTAYRKAALKNHPGTCKAQVAFQLIHGLPSLPTVIYAVDKVGEDKKDEATAKFQRIAFAYAVLSDPVRRKRYDDTGSTSESIVDSDGFSWTDFYREQYRDVVTEEAISKFAKKYKGSDEERDDLLAAYEKFKGNMGKIYQTVMLSNVLEDDDRFRKILDDAIAAGDVPAHKAYTNESQRSKEQRIKNAQREAKEAEEHAAELKAREKSSGKKSKKSKDEPSSMADLAAMIQRNQSSRMSALDKLAEKYGAVPKAKGGAKKRGAKVLEEPDISEEQFQALQANMAKKAKKGRGG